VLKIQIGPREGPLLGAVLVGLLAGFRFTMGYQLAATIAVIIVGGFFVLKWVMRVVEK
jgi:hypothetical protein